MTVKRKVLFLCTGNSCRSQMAEAIVNFRLGERWKRSARGRNLQALSTRKRWQRWLKSELIIKAARSRPMNSEGVDFDLVVTLCEDAAENCPVWLGKGKRVHHSIPDPAKTNEMDDFRKVRDDIEREIIYLLVNDAN